MAIKKRFRDLIERSPVDLNPPEAIVLTYCVCCVGNNACGWNGWTVEAALRHGEVLRTEDMLLLYDADQRCPRCGNETFRTGSSFEYNINPIPLAGELSADIEILPVEYED